MSGGGDDDDEAGTKVLDNTLKHALFLAGRPPGFVFSLWAPNVEEFAPGREVPLKATSLALPASIFAPSAEQTAQLRPRRINNNGDCYVYVVYVDQRTAAYCAFLQEVHKCPVRFTFDRNTVSGKLEVAGVRVPEQIPTYAQWLVEHPEGV